MFMHLLKPISLEDLSNPEQEIKTKEVPIHRHVRDIEGFIYDKIIDYNQKYGVHPKYVILDQFGYESLIVSTYYDRLNSVETKNGLPVQIFGLPIIYVENGPSIVAAMGDAAEEKTQRWFDEDGE